MSKSLGNSLLVDAMVTRVRPVELRYYLGQAHYRSDIEYSAEALDEAVAAYRRIENFVTRAAEAVAPADEPGDEPTALAGALAAAGATGAVGAGAGADITGAGSSGAGTGTAGEAPARACRRRVRGGAGRRPGLPQALAVCTTRSGTATTRWPPGTPPRRRAPGRGPGHAGRARPRPARPSRGPPAGPGDDLHAVVARWSRSP